MTSRAFAALLATGVLLGCASRKLESCAASMILIGPGLLTLDCRPPAALEP